MRFLHTSDWHLGKTLEGYSRLDEQEIFVESLIQKVEKEKVDLVIIAGDIYDTINPPAKAETLYYRALKGLSGNGKRVVVVIPGNHDHAERLGASSPLVQEQGILLLTNLSEANMPEQIGNFKVLESGVGYVKCSICDENVVIGALPYPSEKTLNTRIYESMEEKDMQVAYNEKLKAIIDEIDGKFQEDSVNLFVSHLYVQGGEESDSERHIQLGGSYAVSKSFLPKKAQYIALGHLHKPQRIRKSVPWIVYSGSPIQYSKSEIGYSKGCYIVDIKAKEEPIVEQWLIPNTKPVMVIRAKGVENAILKLEDLKGKEALIYLEIETDTYIDQESIKRIKAVRKDLLEIKPIIEEQDINNAIEYEVVEKNICNLFKTFYLNERQVEPTDELMDLFKEIVEEGEQI